MSADGLPMAARCCPYNHVRHSATPPRRLDNRGRWATRKGVTAKGNTTKGPERLILRAGGHPAVHR
jgi:hypothetical protein